MLAVPQLMPLCLTPKRTTDSSDYILQSKVALLRTSHRFVYWPQCIYSGDPILLSQFVLATVHLQWRFHPTVPRSALSPEVSHDG